MSFTGSWTPAFGMSNPSAQTGELAAPNGPGAEVLTPNQRAWRRFKRNWPAWWSMWVLAILIALAAAWPLGLKLTSSLGGRAAFLARQLQPDRVSDAQFQPPNPAHWFGTDVHGRDLLSRMLYGAQVSFLVGLVGGLISLIIGVLWGALAGYFGGRIDGVLMRVVDILYSLPSIIFVIVLITTLEGAAKRWASHLGAQDLDVSARLLLLVVGLGAVSWLTMARIVRGQVLSLRQRPFVQASRALGAGRVRILLRHIIPNTLGVVVVYMALTIPSII